MSLPIFQTSDRDLSLMQTRWASQLNPLLINAVSQASILPNIQLSIGDNVINHLQGRPLRGYIIVGMRGGFSQVYDVTSPQPSLTLILNSSAAVVVDLMVL